MHGCNRSAGATAKRPRWPFICALTLTLAACAQLGGGRQPALSPGVPPGDPLPAAITAVAQAPVAAGREFQGGVVAAPEPEAAEAAARVLERGGNAIDAAAVALLVLAVVEPQSSGIGGGAFMMIHLGLSGQTLIVDSRETAPDAATADMFGDAPFAIASTSGLAAGVPGAIAGIEAALRRWGTMPLAEALAPAIALAEDGFVVGPRLAASIADGLKDGGRLANEPGSAAFEVARRSFAPNGKALAEGDRLMQPDLAATLQAIATRGPRAFYDCADEAGIATAMIAAQRAHRGASAALAGRMTCADLAAAAAAGPALRQPLAGRYRGFVVKTMPPPSSGGLCLLQMLSMLERFPLGDGDAGFGFAAEPTLNVMQEAMRLCFTDRAMWMGDTDAVPELPVAGLIDPGYVRRRAATCPDPDPSDAAYCIAPGQRLARIAAGDPRPFDGDGAVTELMPAARGNEAMEGLETTHVTVIDRWGNIVTVTATIESAWGSGLMVPGHGFLLNNELTDFNLVPAADPRPATFNPGANDAAPGKRPRSSMAPTIVFKVDEVGRERPIAAYGSPGGATIINTVFTMTLNLIDHRMAVQTAIDAPRLSLTSAADGATAAIEPGFDAGVLTRLTALGYRFAEPALIGSVQAVVIDPAAGAQYGGADGRRRGTVIGLPPAGGVRDGGRPRLRVTLLPVRRRRPAPRRQR